jgi:hypothetical protein
MVSPPESTRDDALLFQRLRVSFPYRLAQAIICPVFHQA